MKATIHVEGYGFDTITHDIVIDNGLFRISAPSAGLNKWNEWYQFHSSKIDTTGLWPIHLNYWLGIRGIDASLEVIARGKLRAMCKQAIWLYGKCQKYSVPAFWDKPPEESE